MPLIDDFYLPEPWYETPTPASIRSHTRYRRPFVVVIQANRRSLARASDAAHAQERRSGAC